MHTPDRALEAMVAPAPLTLGQVALLDLYKLPILDGKIDNLNATAFALWLLSMPLEQAVAEAHYPEKAIVWAEKIGVEEYNDRLVKACLAIERFFGMLPKAESSEDDEDAAALKDLKKNKARRERRPRRDRRVRLPRLRVDASPRSSGGSCHPGGAPLPLLAAGTWRAEECDARDGRDSGRDGLVVNGD